MSFVIPWHIKRSIAHASSFTLAKTGRDPIAFVPIPARLSRANAGGKYDICSRKRQLQGRRLSRQGPHFVVRLWIRLRGRQSVAAPAVDRCAGRNEKLRRDLLRSGRADGQRLLALGYREYPGLGE